MDERLSALSQEELYEIAEALDDKIGVVAKHLDGLKVRGAGGLIVKRDIARLEVLKELVAEIEYLYDGREAAHKALSFMFQRMANAYVDEEWMLACESGDDAKRDAANLWMHFQSRFYARGYARYGEWDGRFETMEGVN